MKEKIKKASKYIGIIIVSFLISYYPLSYNLSPLGIAFTAALKYQLAPFGLIGSAIGYLLSPAKEILNIRYIASLIALAIIRGALLKNSKNNSPIICGLISCFVCLITGFTTILSVRVTAYKILLCIFESLLCGGAAYFFKGASRIFPLKQNINEYATKALISSGVSIALIILSLSKFEIGPVNPILFICTYALLLVSMYGSPYFGCFLGSTMALIIALGTGSNYILVAMVLISVILCIFSKTEIPITIIFVVASASIAIPTTDEFGPSLIYAIHFPAACLLFILTTQFLDSKVTKFLSIDYTFQNNHKRTYQGKPSDFKINLGVYQISSDSSAIGDAYSSFYTSDGKYVIVLSDGMGTGKPAYLISNLAVKILKALLKDGVSFKASLGLLNAAIMINSKDETLATADVACIDCQTGRVDLYKAGATATLIKRGHDVLTFEKTSLPIGILRNTNFSHLETQVLNGDIIIMSSDGIWVGDDNRIKQFLSKSDNDSMNNFAKKIAKTALEPGAATDDITVIAARVESCAIN